MKFFYILLALIVSTLFPIYASEISGTVNTSSSNAEGSIITGGSQAIVQEYASVLSGVVITAPKSNYSSGVYSRTISVNLTANGAQKIVYTTDGSSPDCVGSQLFSIPITVSVNTSIKSISCYGSKSSSIITHDYVIKNLSPTQVSSINGNVTVATSSLEVFVTNDSDQFNISILNGVSSPDINIGAFIKNGSGTLPSIVIDSNNESQSKVIIPSGTIINSASSTWSGVFAAPKIRNIVMPSNTGFARSLSMAIEVGAPGIKLSFSKGVRVLLKGQAGKKVLWTLDGISFTEIGSTCLSDSQITSDTLPADGDCRMDVGQDLVIWTRHFTTFVAYVETPVFISSGGGGGGSVSYTGYGGGVPSVSTILPISGTFIQKSTATQLVVATSVVSAPAVIEVAEWKNLTKNLTLGSKGEEVTVLQKILIQAGILKDEPTGYFGANTRKAVLVFQSNNNITVTGTVGPLTRAKLNSLNIKDPGSNLVNVVYTNKKINILPNYNIKFGTRSDQVVALQKFLIDEGLLKTGASGYYGVATKSAVSKYQKLQGLEQTGNVGPKTRTSINEKLCGGKC